MSETNNLVYFLNSVKDILPFEDKHDFNKKILKDKDFRIKVQKLVYLSKFFGWDNHYIYTLNVHGPYSINLAEKYNDKHLFDDESIEILNFNLNNFIDFVNEKSNNFLEASTTALYVFKNQRDSFNKNNCMALLDDLKSNISTEVKLNAYNEIEKFDLINKRDNATPIKEVKTLKYSLKIKIQKIQTTVESMEICHNQTLILGSLEYMNVVMKIEHVETDYKKDLLEFIDYYVTRIEFTLNELSNFINLDLSIIEAIFDQFQDYVSEELKIIPRVDDDEFNYANYY